MNRLERYRRLGETSPGSSRPPYHQYYVLHVYWPFSFLARKFLANCQRKVSVKFFPKVLGQSSRRLFDLSPQRPSWLCHGELLLVLV
jgi:hypothetical protein